MSIDTKSLICRYIQYYLKKYDYSSKKRRVGIQYKGQNYKIPIDIYVHCSNMAIQLTNGEYRQDTTPMEYIETIFELNDAAKTSCTGIVNLMMESLQDKVEKNLIYIKRQSDDPDSFLLTNSEKMTTLAQECYRRIEDSSCKYGDITFTSLALGCGYNIQDEETKQSKRIGHANTLLILKIKNAFTETIKFYLYEPHGYDVKTKQILKFGYINDVFIKELIKHIQSLYSDRVIFQQISRRDISCPEGIQIFTEDGLGYCKMISNLWLYIIIKLMKSDLSDYNKIYIFDHLNIVETCMQQVGSAKLYNIVINFSSEMINHYISTRLSRTQGDRFVSILIRFMEDFFKKRPYLDINQLLLKKDEIEPDSDPEYDYKADSEMYNKKLQQLQESGDKDESEDDDLHKDKCKGIGCLKREIKKFDKDDCKICESNNECKSNYCEKTLFGGRRCKPYPEDPDPITGFKPPSKCDGQRCNTHGECYSGNCTKKRIVMKNGKPVKELDGTLKITEEAIKKCRKVEKMTYLLPKLRK